MPAHLVFWLHEASWKHCKLRSLLRKSGPRSLDNIGQPECLLPTSPSPFPHFSPSIPTWLPLSALSLSLFLYPRRCESPASLLLVLNLASKEEGRVLLKTTEKNLSFKSMRRADSSGALELLFLPWALAGPCSWNTARAQATGDMTRSWSPCGEIRLLRAPPVGGQTVLYGPLCPVWKEVGAWLLDCSSKKWLLPGLAASPELRVTTSPTEHWKRSQ